MTKNTFGWAGPISAASAAAIIALTSTSALAGADYLRIDPTNQLEVAWAWRALLKKAEVTNPEWTGSIAGCNAGSVPYWVGMKTTQAVNWYRAMAGVSAEDTFDPAANAAMPGMTTPPGRPSRSRPRTTPTCRCASGRETGRR